MKKMVMVLIMMMVAAVTFAEEKSNAKASMEETSVEHQEDFDAWFKKVNAEVEARDAELKAGMAEIAQMKKEVEARDAELKAAIAEIAQREKELIAAERKAE